MPRYEIKQGGARAEVNAVSFAAAVNRAVQIGFKDPDSIVLMEDRDAARQKAIDAFDYLAAAQDIKIQARNLRMMRKN